ncbi:AAA family ATPase [Ramlibacter sp. RBP-2]|uniref:AAA family ATPase n=1 Tax=Ramlibacter lithotrophicus TaxID=2606681 RepID=A0A7X6DEN0_9BURK|nr:bifunctional aminoglycoside phosphotransferase/ATP-binding protein [Ramlibacter lithotrophicus]NKE65698.1 AAA family ATPase [Ramlibacter lithotrophicus]
MTPSASHPGASLVAALAASLAAQVIETHISWVLLAGDEAWKIKKPVRLPFVDYGSLAARRHCCAEEVRLNQRLAPSLYLGVSRITGTALAPRIDGAGEAIEYAVRMRRFAVGALFSEQLAAGTLGPAQVDALAALLGDFHEQAPPATPDSGHGSPEGRRRVAFAALEGTGAVATAAELGRLRPWLGAQADTLDALWRERLRAGRVREGHGDLHLDNVVSLDGKVAAFDGIEFDPALRWIDVIDDLAFAVMDLAARGRRDFAFRLLDGWLARTGDHQGVEALRFAAVYRALVRAQVEQLRGPDRADAARRYVDAALSWTRPPAPALTITHGLPGSGKTFQSQRLLERTGAIRIRSDVERKRLAGLAMLEDSRAHGLHLYTADATRRTYAQLEARARALLAAGWPVILDAAFLRRDERAAARALAEELRVPFAILDCQAPPGVLRERLLARRGDASEAGVAVLERLEAVAEPLSPDEQSLRCESL